MALNLDAVFLMTKAFVPGMKRRGWGRVINISSSTLNMVASGYTHYIASKGGVVGFTRALATEMGNHGVTVNAISPSLTRTPGTEGREPRPGAQDMDEEFEQIAKLQAIRRVQVPRRSARRGVVSGERRLGLHDRPDAVCRWRHGAGLTGAAAVRGTRRSFEAEKPC